MTLFAAGILFGSGLTIIIVALCLTASLDLTVHFTEPTTNRPTNRPGETDHEH